MLRRAALLHADQQGAISILTVFAVLVLTMLLGMVMNVGRHVDGKIRMQNAADGAAYSGGVMLARGLNTLAFTNHLLSDVFALTALLREARDRNSEHYVGSILEAWQNVAPVFAASGLPKFVRLGAAIQSRVRLEQELVAAYSEWAAAASARILPVLEAILSRELIPEFQRAVVRVYPDMAQVAAAEVALRNGRPEFGRGPMAGVLWRTMGTVVGGQDEWTAPTFPVVDPNGPLPPEDARYLEAARQQRENLATIYLEQWNSDVLAVFDREAKMGQFANLWRSFTCAYLEQLLDEEYAHRNLPHMLRRPGDSAWERVDFLNRHFTFVGVVYWQKLPAFAPRIFSSPIDGDPQAFAAVRVFVPTPRLVWKQRQTLGPSGAPINGLPGEASELAADAARSPGGTAPDSWYVDRETVPTDWTLVNQHWTAELVPAAVPGLATILQTAPPVPAFGAGSYRLPHLGPADDAAIARLNTH